VELWFVLNHSALLLLEAVQCHEASAPLRMIDSKALVSSRNQVPLVFISGCYCMENDLASITLIVWSNRLSCCACLMSICDVEILQYRQLRIRYFCVAGGIWIVIPVPSPQVSTGSFGQTSINTRKLRPSLNGRYPVR